MKKTRGLWVSIIVVGSLVVGSVVALVAGVRPVLGLDLEGGVSVILQAPSGTSRDVMERALENIRNRVDAFGVGEPLLYLSGTNIEVQIPGLARGTIDERPKDQYCLIGATGQSLGCFPTDSAAKAELTGTSVKPGITNYCLGSDVFADQPSCFGTKDAAGQALKAITVGAPPSPTPSASPSAAGEGPQPPSQYCLLNTGLSTAPCYDTQVKADAALKAISVQENVTQYCLEDEAGKTLGGDAAGCFTRQTDAQDALQAVTAQHETNQYCVLSSADQNLGCFITRDLAQARLQATGQERLLSVIGTTARLEQRQVLNTIAQGSPDYGTTPLTCSTTAERQTKACSFEALKDKTVVFRGPGGAKYQLGPVLITGDAIKKATAVYNTGTSGTPGWQIDFTTTSEGAKTFEDVTGRLLNQQLAIIVDNVVISAPTVQGTISTQGQITGSFTQNRAKDLATQLNAGALPVNLATQSVQTVSPTLGQESLHEGLIAGIVGLVLLALYLLFYYRLLGIVAWLGMSIWAVLAIALVSISGRAFGYSLTLAGIAGLVISLGVTADSYIVFFERLKDEVRHGRTPRAAVQPAFKRAYKTIVAADIVTALAAVILYVTAISSVRGFALTLGVATGLDLFVVYFFKRPTVFLIARSERLVNMHGFGLTSGVAGERLSDEPMPAMAGGSR